MAEQKFYDMTDTAENIDRVIHDLVEVATEENDGKVLMVEKVEDEETDEVSVNIVEADLPVLEGNRNEIIAFDGEGWGKQSGVYAYETNKTFFNYYYGYGTFKLGGLGRYTYKDSLLTELRLIEIIDSEEVVVYDMLTDENFSSISKTINSYSKRPYIGRTSEYTLIEEPINQILIRRKRSWDPDYLDIQRCIFLPFNTSRKGRIEFMCDDSISLSLCSPSDDVGIPLAGVIYDKEKSCYVYNIPQESNMILKNLRADCDMFSINGGGLFSMSRGSRFTMHGGKADISHNAELYMHGNAKIHVDAGAQLFLHEGGWITADGEARMHIHDESRFDMGDSANVHIHGSSEVGINDGSKFWMAGDDSGSPEVAFNGSCKFFMNGDTGYYGSDNFKPTWKDPIICVDKAHLVYCGAYSDVGTAEAMKAIGTPDEPTPYPFLSLERAKVMIGGSNYDDPRYATTFYTDYPDFTEFRIKDFNLTGDMTITNIIITNLRTGEIVYNMSEDTNFSSISSSSSPLFSPGEFTLSTSPNTISFPANQSTTYKYIGIKSSLFPYDITSETGKNRYSVQVISNSTSPSIYLQAIYQSDSKNLLAIPAVGEATYTMPPMDNVGSTWVKIGTDEGNVQVHVLNNSFLQMSGNSHSEMHNDSFFIMKNRPENSVLETKARGLYEAENNAIGTITVASSRKAEIKAAGNGFIRNYATNGTVQPAIFNSSGAGASGRIAGTNEPGQIFNLEVLEGTSYFPGTYTNQPLTYKLRSSTSFIIVRQGTADAPIINELHELPEGATGIFWEDLTEEEKLPWYKKADNGHEKVEGSPFFQMVNNSSIDLDDGIDITGDSTGLYLNNEKIATEYSYETEEEGETILNTVNIETLFTELQSALARIAELEETIQTLNS